MFINQLSIFVENRQGRLSEITDILAKTKIDIRAICIADTTDFGILRLIVNNPEAAVKALKEEGITASLTKVIAIAIDDRLGGLAVALRAVTDVGIEYMYAYGNKIGDKSIVILRVEDNNKALEMIKQNKLEIVDQNTLLSHK